MSSPPHPIAIFSDFDGTITLKDTGTIIIDHCMTYETRRSLDLDILHGRRTFRDAVYEMWASVNLSWTDAVNLLSNTHLDPGFPAFWDLLKKNQIGLTVVSAGLTPLCELYLSKFQKEVSEDEKMFLKILANEVEVGESWKIVYRDETDYGHDKGAAIRDLKQSSKNKERPFIIFCGDGVSDISAAKEADIVFCKKGKDLEWWCKENAVNFVAWDHFGQIHEWVEDALANPEKLRQGLRN
ncbi:hypothetical protein HDV05_000747 [Chytridiales sp. JEL 0842]|nr:hypothetical protein HDV05_000747 [Chytridiales sp. JEL 0842]